MISLLITPEHLQELKTICDDSEGMDTGGTLYEAILEWLGSIAPLPDFIVIDEAMTETFKDYLSKHRESLMAYQPKIEALRLPSKAQWIEVLSWKKPPPYRQIKADDE